jgi:hypothetical protein
MHITLHPGPLDRYHPRVMIDPLPDQRDLARPLPRIPEPDLVRARAALRRALGVLEPRAFQEGLDPLKYAGLAEVHVRSDPELGVVIVHRCIGKGVRDPSECVRCQCGWRDDGLCIGEADHIAEQVDRMNLRTRGADRRLSIMPLRAQQRRPLAAHCSIRTPTPLDCS